jgi:hypothetical protein
MSRFGISQNFRNATLLGRFARTEHETKNDKAPKEPKEPKIVADNESSSSSSSSSASVPTASKKVKKLSTSQSQPSANKLSAVTARYVTKSADHL